MARFLFVVPPLTSHVIRAAAIADELVRRGHEVTWAGYEAAIGHVLPPGADLIALDGPGDAAARDHLLARSRAVRGVEGVRFLWGEFFAPLARAMLAGVEAAIAASRPDLVVADQMTLAGALAARRTRSRWATLAPTGDVRQSLRRWPVLMAWIDTLLAEVQREADLAPVPHGEVSPLLVLALTTPLLAGPDAVYPPQTAFVGPTLGPRAGEAPFPFDELAPGRRVLVSLGTMAAEREERFYAALKRALADAPCQVIVSARPELRPWPGNFLVRDWLPQLALLPLVDAVVSHGGYNTVCEALAFGRPLVVLPIRDDQPALAERVVALGAGLRLPFARPRPAALATAVGRVLE
ncbi:MAG: glycosyltransferase, partial [Gemmatimonadota bacterium]